MSLCSQFSGAGSKISFSPNPSKVMFSQTKIQTYTGGNTLRVPTMQVASPRSLGSFVMKPLSQQIEVFKYGQLFQIQVEVAKGKKSSQN